jgi:6-pyruvoyltetrahydropterin/6-carboxytetrahydropterin synthase
MYSVKVRDHIMIAHSFKNELFGSAQRLHGATYVVDVSFSSEKLNEANTVIDIGKAHQVVTEVLHPLRYQNLDELPDLKGHLTTTEFLCRYIHDKVKETIVDIFKGKISVTLGESHIAWASYEE